MISVATAMEALFQTWTLETRARELLADVLNLRWPRLGEEEEEEVEEEARGQEKRRRGQQGGQRQTCALHCVCIVFLRYFV